MKQDEFVYITKAELKSLIENKLQKAGLPEDHAQTVADHLAYADSRGVHSHGAVRVEYYAERIAKGGSTRNPQMTLNKTSAGCAILDGDNAVGFVVAKQGMEEAIAMARENGVAVVGMRRMGHCGTLSYYLRMAAEEGMVGISMCQSDPMVVPYGGTEAFFGTNPIGFAAPVKNGPPLVFDMATTVGAWGKILDARAKNRAIPPDWAVDQEGEATEDPFAVRGLLPVAGAKGYGLMMMVDVLSGVLMGAPFGPNVSSMYADLSQGRELGQIHIVINPDFFVGSEQFLTQMKAMMERLHQVRPKEENQPVKYPGESSDERLKQYEQTGIPIVKEIYDYLTGEAVHFDRYDQGNPFAIQEEN